MDGLAFETLVKQVTDALMMRLEQEHKPVLLVLETTLTASELTQLNTVFKVTNCCATADADVILCGALLFTRLARIAKLVPQAGEETLCDHLLAGKPLMMMADPSALMAVRKAARYALYQEVQQITLTLERFGVTFVRRDACCEELLQHCPKRKLSTAKRPKEVLTEQRVQALVAQGAVEISCSEQTIVTALAHDYLRKNKIKLALT